MLRSVLALALVALARGDYLLRQFFPFPAEGCVGESQPKDIYNGVCYPFVYNDGGELEYYSSVACNSQTSFNVSFYSTASCTGTPTHVITEDVNLYNGCKEYGTLGFANMVCVSRTLDPTIPLGPSLFSLDQYYVSDGSPSAATCPPVGEGAQLVMRNIIDASSEPLNTCIHNTGGTIDSSYILSCNPLSPLTLRIQLFGTSDCTGPEQPSGYDDRGCSNLNLSFSSLTSFHSPLMTGSSLTEPIPYRSKIVLFLNSGTRCLSPPSPPAAAASSLSLSPAGLIGIGAGGGLAVAALAFAAHAFYRRYRPLGSSAFSADRARSLPLTASGRETAVASTPLLASGGGWSAGKGSQLKASLTTI